jgi:hypothetical protein
MEVGLFTPPGPRGQAVTSQVGRVHYHRSQQRIGKVELGGTANLCAIVVAWTLADGLLRVGFRLGELKFETQGEYIGQIALNMPEPPTAHRAVDVVANGKVEARSHSTPNPDS